MCAEGQPRRGESLGAHDASGRAAQCVRPFLGWTLLLTDPRAAFLLLSQILHAVLPKPVARQQAAEGTVPRLASLPSPLLTLHSTSFNFEFPMFWEASTGVSSGGNSSRRERGAARTHRGPSSNRKVSVLCRGKAARGQVHRSVWAQWRPTEARLTPHVPAVACSCVLWTQVSHGCGSWLWPGSTAALPSIHGSGTSRPPGRGTRKPQKSERMAPTHVHGRVTGTSAPIRWSRASHTGARSQGPRSHSVPQHMAVTHWSASFVQAGWIIRMRKKNPPLSGAPGRNLPSTGGRKGEEGRATRGSPSSKAVVLGGGNHHHAVLCTRCLSPASLPLH